MNTLATGFTIIDWQTFHVHGEACKRMIRVLMKGPVAANPSHPGTNSHTKPCHSLAHPWLIQKMTKLFIPGCQYLQAIIQRKIRLKAKARQGKADFTPLMPCPDSQLEDFIDGSRRYYEVRHPSYFSCVKLLKRLEVQMKDRGALVCEMSLFHVVVDGVIKLWRGRGGSDGADFFQKIYT